MALLVVLAPGRVRAQDDGLSETDRRVLEVFTGTVETPTFIYHYRPGGKAEAMVPHFASRQEAALARVQQVLEMQLTWRVHVFLYEDGEEVMRLTGFTGVGGFASAAAIHEPFDIHAEHELTHVVAAPLVQGATVPPDGFLNEGLANAVTEFVDRVHVHDDAAFFLEHDLLPPLKSLRPTFPNAPGNPYLRSYNVAGSFCLFVIERYGIERYKQYHMNEPAARSILGKSTDLLEKEWRAFLSTRAVPEGLERHLRASFKVDPLDRAAFARRLGLPMTREERGGPNDWRLLLGETRLDKWSAQAGTWEWRAGALAGTAVAGGDLGWYRYDGGVAGDLVLRGGVRLEGGGSVADIYFNMGDAGRNTVGLGEFGIQMVGPDGTACDNLAIPLEVGRWYDVAIVSFYDRARVYLDDQLVLERKDDIWTTDNGKIALGVRAGAASFRDLKIRPIVEPNPTAKPTPVVSGTTRVAPLAGGGDFAVDAAKRVITVRNEGPFNLGVVEGTTFSSGQIKVHVYLARGHAAKVAFNVRGDERNEVILAPNGVFLFGKPNRAVYATRWKPRAGRWYRLLVENDAGTGRVYLNGHLVLEGRDLLHAHEGGIGVGAEGDVVHFRDLGVRGFGEAAPSPTAPMAPGPGAGAAAGGGGSEGYAKLAADTGSLGSWEGDSKAKWSVRGGVLTGINDAGFDRLVYARETYGAYALEAEVRIGESPCAVRIETNLDEAGGSQALILTSWGIFLVGRDGALVGQEPAAALVPGDWYRVTLVNRAGAGEDEVRIGGKPIVRGPNLLDEQPGRIAVGAEKGKVELKDLRVRPM